MELSEWREWWKRTGESELQALLMAIWDPIMVSDAPEAFSEYDSEALPLARRLYEGASADDVAEYLAEIAANIMECDYDKAEYGTVGQSIVEWYASSTARFANRSARPPSSR